MVSACVIMVPQPVVMVPQSVVSYQIVHYCFAPCKIPQPVDITAFNAICLFV
nr:MAG TPA: hypothetical protein [Caudoviricetes sp.]